MVVAPETFAASDLASAGCSDGGDCRAAFLDSVGENMLAGLVILRDLGIETRPLKPEIRAPDLGNVNPEPQTLSSRPQTLLIDGPR